MRRIMDTIQNNMILSIMSNAISQGRIKNFDKTFKRIVSAYVPVSQDVTNSLTGSHTMTFFYVGLAQKAIYDMCTNSYNLSRNEAAKLASLTKMLFEGTGIFLANDGTCIFYCGIRQHDFSNFMSLENNSEPYIHEFLTYLTDGDAAFFLTRFALLSLKINQMQSLLTIRYLLKQYLKAHPYTTYKHCIIKDCEAIDEELKDALQEAKTEETYVSFAKICREGIERLPYVDESFISYVDCQFQKTKLVLKEILSPTPSDEFTQTYDEFIKSIPIDINGFIKKYLRELIDDDEE